MLGRQAGFLEQRPDFKIFFNRKYTGKPHQAATGHGKPGQSPGFCIALHIRRAAFARIPDWQAETNLWLTIARRPSEVTLGRQPQARSGPPWSNEIVTLRFNAMPNSRISSGWNVAQDTR